MQSLKEVKSILRALTVLSLTAVLTGGCQAPSYTVNHQMMDYPRSTVRDALNLLQAPLHWDEADIVGCAGVFGVTGGLMVGADRRVRRFTLDHRSKLMDDVTDFAVPFGLYQNVQYSELGIFLFAYPAGDYELADTAFMALEATTFSHLLVGGINSATKRERPNSTYDPYAFHFNDSFSHRMGSSAFPSDDVTAAFSWASVLSARADMPWVSAVSYGLAGLVGVTQVYRNDHWSSDVWMGAMLGTVVGQTIVKYNTAGQNRVAITPLINPDWAGIGVNLRF